MPSKSPAQARLMAAAAHSPKFAKKVGVPQKVASEFNQADAGTGILSGGKMRGGDGHKVGSKMHSADSRRDLGMDLASQMAGPGSSGGDVY